MSHVSIPLDNDCTFAKEPCPVFRFDDYISVSHHGPQITLLNTEGETVQVRLLADGYSDLGRVKIRVYVYSECVWQFWRKFYAIPLVQREHETFQESSATLFAEGSDHLHWGNPTAWYAMSDDPYHLGICKGDAQSALLFQNGRCVARLAHVVAYDIPIVGFAPGVMPETRGIRS